MSLAAATTETHIDESGAHPVITGTGIKVSLIASEYEHQGMTPDEIAEAHTHLGLAEIHAALSYYYDHREQIRREWEETENLIASLRGRYPSRLGARKGQAL